MKNSLFSFVLLLTSSILLCKIIMPPPSLAQPAASLDTLPNHTVSISFDLEKSALSGTSRINLPGDTPLALHCGPLTITGAILEQDNKTPLLVAANSDNIIRLKAIPESRTLLLSWTMTVDNPFAGSNLITKDGITLAGFWHPIAEQDMLYTLNATLPPGFTGISEGEQLTTTEKNGRQQFQASFAYPLRAVHFAAGPYIVQSLQQNNVTIYSYFFTEDNHLAAEYLQKTAEYIKRFEALIGPFPYSRYSIVENRLPTGYGMPGFTLLGQAVIRLPFIKDTSLGHEVLHSWFGNSVGLAGSGGNWCEGLTSYLADQSFARDLGKGTEYRKQQLLRYEAFVDADNSMPLSAFTGAGDNQPVAKKIRAIGYDKGSMVFHMLNREIGEAAFSQGLRDLYRQKKNQRASWQDIERAFSQAANRDLQPFFSQWLARTDSPNLSMEEITLDQKKGRSVVQFHLVQDNEQPYTLQVPISIKTLGGEIRQLVALNQLQQDVSITTKTLPTEIIMDPDYDLFRSLSQEEIPPTWARFLGASQKTIILPEDQAQAAIYQPLFDRLQAQGIPVKTTAEVGNQDLGTGSFLFAGDSPLRRSLFAGPTAAEKKEGFTLQARKNPLDPEQTMILVDSSSASETTAPVRKLSHYGKYSSLHFKNGRIIDKQIAPSKDGYRLDLLPTPSGMPTQAAQDFSAIINDLEKSQVVYVGETHTSYGDHLLQLQILQALYAKNKNLAIGMEMFPRSSQPALDQYITDEKMTEKDFIKKSRYFAVWGFDYRFYRDIIGFAKNNKLEIIGLNLDKKIVSQVFREGHTDTISDEDLATIAADRDLDVAGYRNRLQAVHGRHKSSGDETKKGFGGFLQSQAIWDETMAESITNYLQKNPEKSMVIIAGAGHVYKDGAIPLRVQRRRPDIRQSVLISNNGMDSGREQGRQVDYLMFPRPVELSPSPKVGVVLEEEKEDTATGKEGRIRIVGISPHGNGKEAGLKEQDIIVSVDGTPVHDVADLKIALLDKEVGESVSLQIFRQRELFSDQALDIALKLTSMKGAGMMMPPGHPKR